MTAQLATARAGAARAKAPNNSFEFQEDHFTEVLFALRDQGGRERPRSQ